VSQRQDQQSRVSGRAAGQRSAKPKALPGSFVGWLRFFKIVVPLVAVLIFAAVGGASRGQAKQSYPGTSTARAVASQLSSFGLMDPAASVTCTDVDRGELAISHCTEFSDSQHRRVMVKFDVQYLDDQGNYSLDVPGTLEGPLIHGNSLA
jgi:hypothetical protein